MLAFVFAAFVPGAASAQTSCTVSGSNPILVISKVGNTLSCATRSTDTGTLGSNSICFVSRYSGYDFAYGSSCEVSPASVAGGSSSGTISVTAGASCIGGSPHLGICNATGGLVKFTSSKLSAFGTLSFTFDSSKPGVGAFGTISTSAGGDNIAPTVTISGVPESASAPFTATFQFSENVSGFSVGDIAVGNGAASEFAGSGATYTALITPAAHGTMTVEVPAGVAQDAAGNLNEASSKATATYIDHDYVRRHTQRVISNFMNARADQITASDPDLVARLGVAGGGAMAPTFDASGTLDNNQISFAGSLRQMASARAESRMQRQPVAMGLGMGSGAGQASPALGLDAWAKGQWSRSDQDGTVSELGLLYTGVDYRLSSSLLVGVLAQFDWMKQKDGGQSTAVDGLGWMVGPYAVARLDENLLFDVRAAFGRSNNDVTPFGTYTDSFETDRWLARARLTGDFEYGAWQFTPHVGVIYFEEEQKSYVDSLGVAIGAQTSSLGRLTFGPEIAYRWHEGETIIVPRLAVKGIWDFDSAPLVDVMTGLTDGSTADPRARVEGGLATVFANGWALQAEAYYDGIGASDFEVYGASLVMNVPLD